MTAENGISTPSYEYPGITTNTQMKNENSICQNNLSIQVHIAS